MKVRVRDRKVTASNAESKDEPFACSSLLHSGVSRALGQGHLCQCLWLCLILGGPVQGGLWDGKSMRKGRFLTRFQTDSVGPSRF